MAELEWIFLRNAVVAAALVGEDAAEPLRENLLAEAAITGQLTREMAAEAAREQSAEELERQHVGMDALAAALGGLVEQMPVSSSGAAALLADLAQEGLWAEPAEEVARAVSQHGSRQSETTGQDAAVSLVEALTRSAAAERGAAATMRDAADQLPALGPSDTARRPEMQAGETSSGWKGAERYGSEELSAPPSDLERWAAEVLDDNGRFEQDARRQGGGLRTGGRQAGQAGLPAMSADDWDGQTALGPLGQQTRGGHTSMAEISRFFERDARRY